MSEVTTDALRKTIEQYRRMLEYISGSPSNVLPHELAAFDALVADAENWRARTNVDEHLDELAKDPEFCKEYALLDLQELKEKAANWDKLESLVIVGKTLRIQTSSHFNCELSYENVGLFIIASGNCLAEALRAVPE